MPKQFEAETSYNAPPVMFLGRLWKMSLSTVNGTIYKTAPCLLLKSEREANDVATMVRQFCLDKLGKPAEQKAGLVIWDATDGNVVLETGATPEGFAINIYETSKAAGTFGFWVLSRPEGKRLTPLLRHCRVVTALQG
jgi:hypothetical protein